MLKELLGAFVQKKCLLVSSFTGRDTAYKVSTSLLKLPRRPYTLFPRSPPPARNLPEEQRCEFQSQVQGSPITCKSQLLPKEEKPRFVGTCSATWHLRYHTRMRTVWQSRTLLPEPCSSSLFTQLSGEPSEPYGTLSQWPHLRDLNPDPWSSAG